MERRYLAYIARQDLRIYEYKIVLMLLEKPYTQAQLARELSLARQNVNKYISSLKRKGLIEVELVDGRNQYYKAVTDMKRLQEVMEGQIKI